MMPVLGSLGFLIIASVIAGLYRLRGIDTAPVEVARWTPEPVDDATLIREVEIDWFERLYFDVPAYGEEVA